MNFDQFTDNTSLHYLHAYALLYPHVMAKMSSELPAYIFNESIGGKKPINCMEPKFRKKSKKEDTKGKKQKAADTLAEAITSLSKPDPKSNTEHCILLEGQRDARTESVKRLWKSAKEEEKKTKAKLKACFIAFKSLLQNDQAPQDVYDSDFSDDFGEPLGHIFREIIKKKTEIKKLDKKIAKLEKDGLLKTDESNL